MHTTQFRRWLAGAAVAIGATITLSASAGAQNIAQGKSAFQSSIREFFTANRAVDGNTDGNIGNGSVSHTESDPQAWWFVDLGSTFTVTGITLWNRTDCCGDRLSAFNVSVLADGTTNIGSILAPTVWTQFFPGTAGVTQAFTPPSNVNGRYVKVQLTGTNFLQLAEVEVNGRPVTTIPEPGTTGLLAAGVVVMGIVVRRRRIAIVR